MEKQPELEEEEGGLPRAHPCVSLAGSPGGSAVPAAAGHGAQLPQQQRGQAAGGAGEPRGRASVPCHLSFPGKGWAAAVGQCKPLSPPWLEHSRS